MWWIDEPHLAGSHNPNLHELRSLRGIGFSALVCLLDEDEVRTTLRYSVEDATRMGYAWHSIPVSDYHAPTLRQMRRFLDLVEHECGSGKLMVHCQAGVGRTGTMAAAYWIARRHSAPEAIGKVRRARPWAIESEEQRERLHELERHFAAGR